MNRRLLFSGVICVLIIGLLIAVYPVGVVRAESLDSQNSTLNFNTLEDDTNPPYQSGGQIRNANLERFFLREKQNHEMLELTFSQAERLSTRFEELIARAKENGKDTSALESALVVLKSKISEGLLKNNEIEILIKEHQGFDSDGKVTNEETARKTVNTIHQGNQEIRQILIQGMKAVREAAKDYRDDNPRPTQAPGKNPL